MDLIDEQHIARLQVGEQRGEIASALDHRARRTAQIDPEFIGDHVRQCGLAQTRRSENQYMIERFAAPRAASM